MDIKLFFDKYIDKLVKGGNKQIFDLKYWNVFIDTKNEWIENILIQQISSNNKIKTINKVIKNFDKNLSLIGEMIVGNYFIFGEEPTNADICLFAVLIQFFEGPFLNIPQLDYFFRLKGSSNDVGSTSQVYNQKGKGKEIIKNEEEELNEFKYNNEEIPNEIEKDEIEEVKEIVENKGLIIKFEDDRINILFNFVQNMKRKLGFNEESDWQNLRESPWELNYEPEDFSQKRYIGPFQIETDELLGINKLLFYERIIDLWSLITRKKRFEKNKRDKLWKKIIRIIKGKAKPSIGDFDELIQKILEKLISYIHSTFWDYIKIKYYGTITLNCLASYLCNLGRGKTLQEGEDCKEYFFEKVKKYGEIVFRDIEIFNLNSAESLKEKKKEIALISIQQCYIAAKISNESIKEINELKINENINKAIKQLNNDEEGEEGRN
ncbi:unnamed protein product [Meloidogyne enterolobii]|uniref:Uncharacterized protein n=1 Tax=Meloidogyne enterolobii TaxID=390850 RepID=A0ACB0ZWN8_MELEN